MCDTCGCNVTPGNEHLLEAHGHLHKTASGRESVEVLKGLLDANDHQALHNREHFDRHGVLAVNLMSSPGAGKTALLEATIEGLGGRLIDPDPTAGRREGRVVCRERLGGLLRYYHRRPAA